MRRHRIKVMSGEPINLTNQVLIAMPGMAAFLAAELTTALQKN